MHEGEASDEQLLDRYFLGEAKAFKLFFTRHQGRAFAYYAYAFVYGKRKGLDPELVREASQEAFLRLHRSIHQYESGRPALTWFFTIVHNCVIDAIRKGQRPSAEIMLANRDEIAANPVERDRELEVGMNQLSEEQRQLMHYRAVEELSFKEISRLTGKSDSNLRKLFERTRKTLKKSLTGNKDMPPSILLNQALATEEARRYNCGYSALRLFSISYQRTNSCLRESL